jgi:hypothetical protein
MSPRAILPLPRYARLLGRALSGAEPALRDALRIEGIPAEAFSEADVAWSRALGGPEAAALCALFVTALLEGRAEADRTVPGGLVFEGPILPFLPAPKKP